MIDVPENGFVLVLNNVLERPPHRNCLHAGPTGLPSSPRSIAILSGDPTGSRGSTSLPPRCSQFRCSRLRAKKTLGRNVSPESGCPSAPASRPPRAFFFVLSGREEPRSPPSTSRQSP